MSPKSENSINRKKASQEGIDCQREREQSEEGTNSDQGGACNFGYQALSDRQRYFEEHQKRFLGLGYGRRLRLA